MNISVVIPVYNSEASLPLLVKRLEPVLNECANQFELILVNDGSSDGSWDIVCDLKIKYPWIQNINLMRNYGQHNAVLCGIREARYEIIVTVDDDLQHPPEEIPKLLTKLNEGFDVVYGYPQKEQHGFWRDIASRITKIALQSTMGIQTAKHVSAFRAFRTHTRDAFTYFQSPFVNIDVLLTWATARFAAIPVRHDERNIGQSNYTVTKLMVHAINMITGFSTVPLRISSFLGFFFMFFGFMILIFTLITFIRYPHFVPGFAFLACSIAIFSGVQLFVLGVMGEYLARIHFRSSNKPSYVILKKNE